MCWALKFDWAAIGSMLGGIGGLVAGCATLALAVFGFRGLSAWRTQLTGTRRVDVGETLLRHIYEADEVLSYITAPFVTAGELGVVERTVGETDDEYRLRQNYEAVHRRYVEHMDIFNNLRAACFSAKATLGGDVYDAAIEVVKLPSHILSAASQLKFREQVLNRLTHQREVGIEVSDREWTDAYDRWNKAHEYFYGLDEGEQLEQKRVAAVGKVEQLVRASIGDEKGRARA